MNNLAAALEKFNPDRHWVWHRNQLHPCQNSDEAALYRSQGGATFQRYPTLAHAAFNEPWPFNINRAQAVRELTHIFPLLITQAGAETRQTVPEPVNGHYWVRKPGPTPRWQPISSATQADEYRLAGLRVTRRRHRNLIAAILIEPAVFALTKMQVIAAARDAMPHYTDTVLDEQEVWIDAREEATA